MGGRKAKRVARARECLLAGGWAQSRANPSQRVACKQENQQGICADIALASRPKYPLPQADQWVTADSPLSQNRGTGN